MGKVNSKSETGEQAIPEANFDLYVADLSPNARSNLMLVEGMGLKPNLKVIDLFKGEHKSDDFTKINPYQLVPAIVDGDLTLWESRAVMGYIANKFGGDKFYSRDPAARAKVDMALYIDATSIQPKAFEWLLPVLFQNKAPGEMEKEKTAFEEVLQKLETNVLKEQNFFAGDSVSIADFSFCATISTLDLIGFNLEGFPKLHAWMNRMMGIEFVVEANKGVERTKEALSPST